MAQPEAEGQFLIARKRRRRANKRREKADNSRDFRHEISATIITKDDGAVSSSSVESEWVLKSDREKFSYSLLPGIAKNISLELWLLLTRVSIFEIGGSSRSTRTYTTSELYNFRATDFRMIMRIMFITQVLQFRSLVTFSTQISIFSHVKPSN